MDPPLRGRDSSPDDLPIGCLFALMVKPPTGRQEMACLGQKATNDYQSEYADEQEKAPIGEQAENHSNLPPIRLPHSAILLKCFRFAHFCEILVTLSLCAPTGRAAKRLSEITGRPAQTIHRLLGFSPEKENFSHHELDPLPVDFVVVDEASMLDLKLADRLLGAVDLPAHVLFVGDVDQLPSVGAGNVLRNLIASGRIPVAHLTEVFRQTADSGIISAVHSPRTG